MSKIKINVPVVGQYFGIFLSSDEEFASKIKAAPFKQVSLLLIAFLHTRQDKDKSKPGKDVWVAQYEFDNAPGRIDSLLERARAVNPDIQVVLSLGWGQRDYERAVASPTEFADSVKALVDKHKVDGFDLDYEYDSKKPEVPVNKDDMKKLVEALRAKLPRGEKLLTITPADTRGLTGETLGLFDVVMPQSYKHCGNGTTIEEYRTPALAPDYSKIVVGRNTEPCQFKHAPDDVQVAVDLYKKNHAAGIFAWRLDNDPEFKSAKKMWELVHPPFRDAPAGAITRVAVREGEVLDAIQVTTDHALSPHGGGGGVLREDAVIPEGDRLVEITGWTGGWRGLSRVVLQITLKTEKGKTFGPYGSMHASEGGKVPLEIKAEPGKSIVALHGTTVYAPAAGAGRDGDYVIEHLDGVFA